MKKKQKNNGIIAFCLFRYFPYGGLQRDMLRIGKICQSNGLGIRVYTMRWEGDVPEGFDVRIVKASGFSNHARALNFSQEIQKLLKNEPVNAVVGFNKMAGLDIYFGADMCLAERLAGRAWLYRLMPRARTFLKLEEAVFGEKSKAFAMLLAQKQIEDFTKHYKLSSDRYELLPCAAAEKYFLQSSNDELQSLRQQYNIPQDAFLILEVASNFHGKGVDRAINAIAALPPEKRKKCYYVVIGSDSASKMLRLAKNEGIADRVIFTGARDDVEIFMQAADFLIHPARVENTGTTIAEALAANLPVVCTASCGYSGIVLDCRAGIVLTEPFQQAELDRAVEKMVDKKLLKGLSACAEELGTRQKLSGLDTRAAEIITDFANGKFKP